MGKGRNKDVRKALDTYIIRTVGSIELCQKG